MERLLSNAGRATEATTAPAAASAPGRRSAAEPTPATLQLVQARFATDAASPAGVCCCVSLLIDGAADAPPPDRFRQPPLRLVVDGEPGLCAALREFFLSHGACAYVEVAGADHWSLLDRTPVSPALVAATDTPVPSDGDGSLAGRALAACQAAAHLNYFDVDVATLAKYLPPGGRRLTLHLALPGLAPEAERARALAGLSSDNLLSDRPPLHAQPQMTMLLPALVAALADLARRPARAWLHDRRGRSLASGLEVRLTLDERALAGVGLHSCARVLARILGRCAAADGFVELVLLSARSGEELLRCPPRNGDTILARAFCDQVESGAAAARPTPVRRARPATAPW